MMKYEINIQCGMYKDKLYVASVDIMFEDSNISVNIFQMKAASLSFDRHCFSVFRHKLWQQGLEITEDTSKEFYVKYNKAPRVHTEFGDLLVSNFTDRVTQYRYTVQSTNPNIDDGKIPRDIEILLDRTITYFHRIQLANYLFQGCDTFTDDIYQRALLATSAMKCLLSSYTKAYEFLNDKITIITDMML